MTDFAAPGEPKPPLSNLQTRILSLYKKLKEVCDERGLRYFAMWGTTLGAVLWEGFIPWDDDMDVAMPFEDYRKFIEICNTELQEDYAFTEYVWFGGKFHDKHSMFTNVFYINHPDMYNGVFLDVVPLIGVPSDSVAFQGFVDEMRVFHRTAMLKEIYDVGTTGLAELEQTALRLQTTESFESAQQVIDFSDPRFVLAKRGFAETVEMKFEDTVIPVSGNFEEDMRCHYGDYSKYPPVETRVSSHCLWALVDEHRGYEEFAAAYGAIEPSLRDFLDRKNHYEGTVVEALFAATDRGDAAEKQLGLERLRRTQVEDELQHIRFSWSFRIGRAITWPGRLLRKRTSVLVHKPSLAGAMLH